MERWVSTCGNRCRESLVAKWFRESERCMNWLLDLAESDGAKCMVTVGSRIGRAPRDRLLPHDLRRRDLVGERGIAIADLH